MKKMHDSPILNIGKDTLIYIPSQLLPALFGFFSVSIYTRVFSPHEYGDYSLIMATISIIVLLAYSWLNQSNLRFFSAHKDNNLNIFMSTSFFTLVASLLFSIIVITSVTKYFLNESIFSKYLFLSISVIISKAFFDSFITVLRANREKNSVSLGIIVSSGLSLATTLVLIHFFDIGISSILIGILLTNIVLVIILNFKFKYQKYIRIEYFSNNLLKEFIDYGFPIIITLLFSWILTLSDRYLISYFIGSEAVGIYSATYSLASYPMSLISSALVFAAFPIIINTWTHGTIEETKNLLSNVTRYYLLISIPAAIGIITLSRELIQIIGSSYSDGYSILPWICFGSFISGLCIYLNKGLELTNNTRILSIFIGIAGISNIIMNLLLIPQYSYYGAAVATAIAYIVYLILSIVISRKFLSWHVNIKSLINILLASLLMAITIFSVKIYITDSLLDILILIITGVIVYFSVLFLLKEIRNEITYIKNRYFY